MTDGFDQTDDDTGESEVQATHAGMAAASAAAGAADGAAVADGGAYAAAGYAPVAASVTPATGVTDAPSAVAGSAGVTGMPAPAQQTPAGSYDLAATQASPIVPSSTQPAAQPTVQPAAQPSTRPAAQAPSQSAPRSPYPMDALPDLRETTNGNGYDDVDKSRDEFTTVYDIIDQLELTLDDAKGSIFTPGMVRVDRDEFAAQLDELKKMLPVQLERASALMREAERRLESAQTQANAIVASAQSRAADMIKDANDQAQFLAGQENVTEIARQKARAILDQAQAKADRLTQGADKYCTTVMEGLQAQLGKLDRDVQAGLNVLYERQRTAGEQLPHLNNNDYPES